MKKLCAALLSVLLMAQGAAAQVVRFDCVAVKAHKLAYQPAELRLEVDRIMRRVAVTDALTRQFAGGSVSGQVEEDDGRRLTLIWTVRDVPKDMRDSMLLADRVKLLQRLTIQRNGTAVLATTLTPKARGSRPYRQDMTCKAG